MSRPPEPCTLSRCLTRFIVPAARQHPPRTHTVWAPVIKQGGANGKAQVEEGRKAVQRPREPSAGCEAVTQEWRTKAARKWVRLSVVEGRCQLARQRESGARVPVSEWGG